jgi:hypothetical protein|tara:strand:+ start:99 stop:656 length:558 start_codon:yes stop_codon:yes gene_type:complete
MFTLSVFAITCLQFGSAFTGVKKPLVNEIGITKPFTGKFDPIGFSKNAKPIELARLRESEIKHARAAMVGATVIPLVEMITKEPGINFVSKMPVDNQMSLLALVAVGEFASMLKGWENPFEGGSSKAFKIREDYQPGDLGFKLKENLTDEEFIELSNKELNNGRLAMFAALGMIVQELVTGETLF